jgi:hypothetical protein
MLPLKGLDAGFWRRVSGAGPTGAGGTLEKFFGIVNDDDAGLKRFLRQQVQL